MKRVVWKLCVIVVVSVFRLIDRILPGGKQIVPEIRLTMCADQDEEASLDNRKFLLAAGRDPKELILVLAAFLAVAEDSGAFRAAPPPPDAQTAVFQDGGIIRDEDAGL